jgi:hypothetical protein
MEKTNSSSEKTHILVIDDWCTEDELKSLDKELVYYFSRGKDNVLRTDLDPSTHRVKDVPQSKGWRVHPLPNDKYSTINHLTSKYNNPDFFKLVENRLIQGRSFKDMNCCHNWVSYYENGDYYKPHHDVAIFSSILYYWRGAKNFTGGELYFPEIEMKIEMKKNRMVLFPSWLIHEVSEIKMNDSTNILELSGRFSITYFFYINT